MAVKRRLGADRSKNRDLLLDATEQLLCEDGYAAITARQVAQKAGLKYQLVYYYFESMDDLILAVIQRNTERRLENFTRALTSSEPLRELWKLNSDPSSAITTTELLALANHRASIRSEIVAAAKQFRSLQIEAVGRLLAAKGVDAETCLPAGIVTIVAALARAMKQDRALGVDEGYEEAVALVERGLDMFSKTGCPEDEKAES